MTLDDIRDRVRAQATLPPRRQAKALRVAAGVTVRELAEVVEVCERSIEFWESGKRRPTGARLVRYAEALALIARELGASPP